MVKVTLSGKGELKAVHIDDRCLSPPTARSSRIDRGRTRRRAPQGGSRDAGEDEGGRWRVAAASAQVVLVVAVALPAAVAGPEIERLIQLLARLPGLGRALRAAPLFLIKKRERSWGRLPARCRPRWRRSRSAASAVISIRAVLARSAPTRGASLRSWWWWRTSPISGTRARARGRALPCARRHIAARRHRPAGPHIDALISARTGSGGD